MGPHSQVQALPCLVQAYMVLSNPTTGSTPRIGQQWDLMFPLDKIIRLNHSAILGFRWDMGQASSAGGFRDRLFQAT